MMYLKAVNKAGNTLGTWSCKYYTVSNEMTVLDFLSGNGPIDNELFVFDEGRDDYVNDKARAVFADEATIVLADSNIGIFVMNENGKTIDKI